jgi:hypothetical protein
MGVVLFALPAPNSYMSWIGAMVSTVFLFKRRVFLNLTDCLSLNVSRQPGRLLPMVVSTKELKPQVPLWMPSYRFPFFSISADYLESTILRTRCMHGWQKIGAISQAFAPIVSGLVTLVASDSRESCSPPRSDYRQLTGCSSWRVRRGSRTSPSRKHCPGRLIRCSIDLGSSLLSLQTLRLPSVPLQDGDSLWGLITGRLCHQRSSQARLLGIVSHRRSVGLPEIKVLVIDLIHEAMYHSLTCPTDQERAQPSSS